MSGKSMFSNCKERLGHQTTTATTTATTNKQRKTKEKINK